MVRRELKHDPLPLRQQLPAPDQVDDRDDLTLEVPADRDQAVVHRMLGAHDSMANGRGYQFGNSGTRHLDHGRLSIDHDDFAPGVCRRVGDGARRRRRDRQCVGDDGLESLGDSSVRSLGVGSHPSDRRTRDDVVELLQQHVLPQRLDLVRRSPAAPRQRQPTTARLREVGARSDGFPPSSRLATSTCRGASRSTARRPRSAPVHPRRPRPRHGRRTRRACPPRSRDTPSRSAIRSARSIISRVGPPPPLPWPNGISDQLLHPCSLKLVSAYRTSAGVISALYVSTGGKCVSTRDPSRPSHQKVEWGKTFSLFQLSF